MKIQFLLSICALAATITGELRQGLNAIDPKITNGILNLTNTLLKGPEIAADPPSQSVAGPSGPWFKARCRGSKLHRATTHNPDQAAKFVTPLNSPWDGTMRGAEELGL
jgi:hypothetical protein